jgi:hypothetical protein
MISKVMTSFADYVADWPCRCVAYSVSIYGNVAELVSLFKKLAKWMVNMYI